jgi:ABC-type Mn2+/Zn2+ transport system permease subunit
MLPFATGLSAVFVAEGLWVSYAFNLTSGASTFAVGAAAFLAVTAWGQIGHTAP